MSNRNFWVSTLVIAGLAVSAGSLRSQGPGPGGPGSIGFAGPGPGGWFGGPVEVMGFAGMHGGKVVKGAPFTAVATSESVETLTDGNHITHKSQTNLFRDSQGRFRREVTLPAIGPLATSGQPKSFVSIHDPVAGVRYELEMNKKIAFKSNAPAPQNAAARDNSGRQRPGSDEVTTTDLGTQVMSGVTVHGTRRTRTIPAAKFGNEKPITSTSEEWYSDDLQMVVMSKRTDPHFGDSTYTVTNIQRTEPAATLFAVPGDFTVQQGGHGHGGRRGHHGPPPPPPAGEVAPSSGN